jgi:hypothetical protein
MRRNLAHRRAYGNASYRELQVICMVRRPALWHHIAGSTASDQCYADDY